MTKSVHQIDKQLSNSSKSQFSVIKDGEVPLNYKIPTRLQTVNQFVLEHPFVSNGGMRFLIFNAKTNGMEKAGVIKRLGRKILIDENAFFAWVETQNEGGC